MKIRTAAFACLGLLIPCVSAHAESQEDAMAEMMATAAKYTQPGPAHDFLKRFLGEWDTETRLTMQGAPSTKESGHIRYSWLMEGRWLQAEFSGQLFGQTMTGLSLMGYDNFRHSYVATTVSSMDTAMNHAEGDVTPAGDVLILYGTIDEYLTGEHDKMVKTVYRFLSEDEFVMELHDLPIGETNTQVLEIHYQRRK